ncbi:helix-turn-helix domain-containing protein [Dyella japonica]|uniref:Transcriptional regulator n=1 Tax=Dyella japonica A8 TaxID=1217721 RepID=A0A075K378_9GAMM|nr:helix-turn-helix transcriptional regulator [Dyella japonica]AIF48147.1 transcriptional regulator [Dyella japonica A8]
MPSDADIRLTFQRRLKEAREERALSQKNLGIEAGIDPFVASTRINRYEQGVHEPDMATIQRLAKALQVPLPYLFATDDRLAAMILAFDKLTSSDKDRLLRDLGQRKGK